jgi:hypothetical protein
VELRAELAQAREDLAARNAEISELKSRISDLEQQQNDRQRLVDMQNAQLKELQDRLRAMETGTATPAGPASTTTAAPITIDAGGDAASAAAAPAAPVGSAPAPAPATPAAAEPEAPTPWYLNKWALIAAVVLILGGLVLLMRRSKPSADNGEAPGRRLSDDEALKASIAKTREAGARIATQADAPVIVPAGKPAPTAAAVREGELALKALQDAVRERPNDLEAHLSLLRFHHSRGDAESYQAAAQAMRAHLPTTLDPRWREAVVMGASLLPKTQMFSQAGWNTPRFDGEGAASAATPTPPAAAPAPAAPASAPAPAAAFDMAGHGAHQPLQHARHLIATIGQVVVIQLIFQIAAENEVIPQGFQGALRQVVIVRLVARTAAFEPFGDVLGHFNGRALHRQRQPFLLLGRQPGRHLKDAQHQGVRFLPNFHLLKAADPFLLHGLSSIDREPSTDGDACPAGDDLPARVRQDTRPPRPRQRAGDILDLRTGI